MSNDKINRRLDDEVPSKEVLLHELQVHQIELEMQNRQLREAQQELEETRDRYADLYDYAPVGYLTLDEKGTVLEINLTGAGMLGMERLNIVGKPLQNRLTPSNIQPFVTHLRQTFSLPGNSVTELLIKAKEGKPRLVNLESLAMAGEKRICRTVMNDVTDQRRMAIALQISRSAQDALLKAIPALVFYLDINLRYLSCSQAFADFVGRLPEEIVGKTVYDLFPHEVAEDLHQVFTSVLQTDKALYGFEHTMEDATGAPFNMSTVLTPFLDFQDKSIGLVGVSIDITAIKAAMHNNNELLTQNRKLTRNLFVVQEEERRYLARELHDELGQWFTAIQAEAQVICNIAKHVPKIHESALAISSSASAVHEVIRGMLHRLRPSLLDELGLADSLRELQRQWSHSHPDIICEFKLDDSLDRLGEERNITIYRLVQEALNNIASHAHAHRVTVSVGLEKAGSSSILVLRVEDDGKGFDSKSVRAGIGLLGMRERVIAAGGEFTIDSSPGRGTKIFSWLPLSKAGA
ncbi:MAG TPA: PAS domain-containing protein [Gallionellaceae bacterium]|nr:PAS domain-containing protein [Gallionellaceae bacterium]